jgi:serine/threonine protein kinase
VVYSSFLEDNVVMKDGLFENSKKCLGDFEIIRELGRGGMGIVYEAWQVSLKRKVALKVISARLGLSSKAVLRFNREAEAAGKLHHTNIVAVYSTGNDDGVHYYAMELIDGPSLQQVIRHLRRGETRSIELSGSDATTAFPSAPTASPVDSTDESSGAGDTLTWISQTLGLPPVFGDSTRAPRLNSGTNSASVPSSSRYFDTVATMIAGVAEALDYAHENGVIHRDIKPANLLLSRDGRVSINDFGLARMLEQPGMTLSGEFVGSPLYMSPEQITAGRAPLDHRTDIYSLGATLYELLTLTPPFPGKSRDEVIAQILHKEPIPPRRRNPKIPVDLETICLKAIERDPDRRYQAAGQLAEDLRRFVSRHVISARRIGPVERAVRWARRNKALTAMACLTLAISLASLVFVYLSDRAHRRNDAKYRALMAAGSGDLATALKEIKQAKVLGAKPEWVLMLSGQVDLFDGKPQEALTHFSAAVEQDSDNLLARAMLADAYLANGRWTDYVNSTNKIQKLEADPETLEAEELLFLGLPFRFTDTNYALSMVDKAIDKRRSFTLARLWRADTLTHFGADRGRSESVMRAQNELNGLVQFDPELLNNPLLRRTRLFNHTTLAGIYRSQGRFEEARKQLMEAESDVKFLQAIPNFFYGNMDRMTYYALKWEFDGLESDLDNMGQLMQVVARNGTAGWLVDAYWASYFRKGGARISQALRQLDEMPQDEYVVWARIVLLMDQGKQEEVKRICQELIDAGRAEAVLPMFFLGERDAIEYARECALNMKEPGQWIISRDVLRFLGDLIEDRELVRRAGESEHARAFAYFAIGLRQLAEGKRQEAKDSFQNGADSPVCYISPVRWAGAFADRMEEDPTWPTWLPTTSVVSKVK